MVLVLCEMQSISSRIWTRIAMFIFYDDNNYTTGTSISYGAPKSVKPFHCYYENLFDMCMVFIETTTILFV